MRDNKGPATATSRREANQVFQLANLTRKDFFCDLGCGDGFVCIWAAPRCNLSIGVEKDPKRAQRAKKNIQKRALQNVLIIKARYEDVTLPTSYLAMYSTNDLELKQFETWKRNAKDNFRIVTVGPPPIPVKPVASKDQFYLTRFPYSEARTGDEWCNAIIKPNLQDVKKRLGKWLADDVIEDIESDFRRKFKR